MYALKICKNILNVEVEDLGKHKIYEHARK